MQTDLPHTLYNPREDTGDPKKRTVASDEVIRLQTEANERRKREMENGEKSYELNELFKK